MDTMAGLGGSTADNVEVEHSGCLQQLLFGVVAFLVLHVDHEGDQDVEDVVALSGGRGTR